MSEIEDEIRRYVAALEAQSSPVGLDEAKERRTRSRRAPLFVGIAAALAVVVAAGFLVANRDTGHTNVVAVSPTTTAAPVARPCPAASLVIRSGNGERLHAKTLPPGFTLTQGDPSDLGSQNMLTYSAPGGGGPRIQLLRYRTTQSPAQLTTGVRHSATVQGRPAIYNDGEPAPDFTSIVWQEAPEVVIVVTGYKMTKDELLAVANGVRYDPGTVDTYPTEMISLTRERALTRLTDPQRPDHLVLTSHGEFRAILKGPGETGHEPNGVTAADPMWVGWTDGPGRGRATVTAIFDRSGPAVYHTSNIPTRLLAALTDRSGPTCAPPFGILTRSEVLARLSVVVGVTISLKLTTLGAFAATKDGFNLASCNINACDPDVPVWVEISSAKGPFFTDEESGPPGRPRNTGSSWQVIAHDARTGPVTSSLDSSESGAGKPPTDLTGIVDLAPQ